MGFAATKNGLMFNAWIAWALVVCQMAKVKQKPRRVNPGQHDQHVVTWYYHLIMSKARPNPGAFISKITG